MAVIGACARQVAGPGVDRALRIIQVKGRIRQGQGETGLVVGAHGADVLPVAFEGVGVDLVALDGGRQDVFAKIVFLAHL